MKEELAKVVKEFNKLMDQNPGPSIHRDILETIGSNMIFSATMLPILVSINDRLGALIEEAEETNVILANIEEE